MGQTFCAGDAGTPYCANLSADNNNCGACGTVCVGGNACNPGQTTGVCGPACAGGQVLCPGTVPPNQSTAYCASLQTDNNNCGVCGDVCVAPATCGSGQCVPPGVLDFNSCGATGATGPSQAACATAYSGTNLAGVVTLSAGIQQWTVPVTGTYRIEAIGAQGAAAQPTIQGGQGADIAGTFTLGGGTVLNILVGQQGLGVGSNFNGGGGGGSFVVTSTGTILVVAGGGGGTRGDAVFSQSASTGPTGITGTSDCGGIGTDLCPGGTATLGGTVGACGSFGSGGGGYAGNGQADTESGDGTGGTSFLGGGVGGTGGICNDQGDGGFGGGGSGNGCQGGGGGGGYSGGGPGCIAGGGGSFNSGANPVNAITSGFGNGAVLITVP